MARRAWTLRDPRDGTEGRDTERPQDGREGRNTEKLLWWQGGQGTEPSLGWARINETLRDSPKRDSGPQACHFRSWSQKPLAGWGVRLYRRAQPACFQTFLQLPELEPGGMARTTTAMGILRGLFRFNGTLLLGP